MSKIALIGASGNIGREIKREALARGHEVIGIGRNPEKLAAEPNLTPAAGDIADPQHLATLLKDAHTVVASVKWTGNAPQLLEAVRESGVDRLIVVVGAGSLDAEPGLKVIDTPEFPPAWKTGAMGAFRALETFRDEKDIDWVAFSPSWTIAPGERTGKFRIGGDQLLRNEAGESLISREDFAVAIVDEIERKEHHRERVTVGY